MAIISTNADIRYCITLELFRKDKGKYIDKLCKFIGLEVNSRVNIEDKLIHLNKNYIIKDGKKRYFTQTTPRFTKIFRLASVIHNWLKKIEIQSRKDGAPIVRLPKPYQSNYHCECSISHDGDNAIAFALMQKK